MKCPNSECDANKENIDWENTLKTCPLCKTELVEKAPPPTLSEYSNLKLEDYVNLYDIVQQSKKEEHVQVPISISSNTDKNQFESAPIVSEITPVEHIRPEERSRIIITPPETPASMLSHSPNPIHTPIPASIRTPEVVVNNESEPEPEKNRDFKVAIEIPETLIDKLKKPIKRSKTTSTYPKTQSKPERPWYSLTKLDVLVLLTVVITVSAMRYYYIVH
jgi:hypothetical protein